MATASIIETVLGRFKREMGVVLCFSMAIAFLMFSVPIFSMQVYDRIIVTRHENSLVVLTCLAVLALLLFGYLDKVRARLVARSAFRFEADFMPRLFALCRRAEMMKPGSNAMLALGDSRRLRDFMCGPGFVALTELPVAPIFLIVCFIFHPLLGLLSTVGAIVMVAIGLIGERRAGKLVRRSNFEDVALRTSEDSAFRHARAIDALGMSDRVATRYLDRYWTAALSSIGTTDRMGSLLSVQKAARLMLQVLTMALGAWLVIRNELSPGMLIAVSIMTARAVAPLDQLGAVWRQVLSARDALKRLRHLFAEMDESSGTDEPVLLAATQLGQIDVAGLALAPAGGRNAVLRNVNFRVEQGASLFITGPTGCGKSTLLLALAGVHPLLAGRISFADHQVGAFSRGEIGGRIGYLPQTADMLPGTLSENISRFGEENPQALAKAVAMAGLSDFISGLPKGLQTRIPEDLSAFSQGQTRCLALARAVYGDPDLLLLDDPLAFLDANGRGAVVDLIRHMSAAGTTVVVVAADPQIQVLCKYSLSLGGGTVERFDLTPDRRRTPRPSQQQAAAA